MRSYRLGRIVLFFLASLPASFGPSLALGAPAAADLRAARDLFAHAEADEDAGRWQEGLDKLQQVLLVKDTAGVRYHVALCEEHLGKLATAWTDYTVADEKARSEQARDVLRLVGKKLAELDPRVPRLTVRIVPPMSDAMLTVDGRPVSPGETTPVDPGPHEVEAMAGERRPPKVTVSLQEGESRSLEVELRPAAQAPTPPDRLPTPVPGAPPALPLPAEASVGGTRRAALLESAGAVVLAGAGAAAYAAAATAQTQAFHACAQTAAPSPRACDAERFPVRAWDWVAVGAWTGAGVLATVAVFSWTGSRGQAGRVVVGPAALRLEGAF